MQAIHAKPRKRSDHAYLETVQNCQLECRIATRGIPVRHERSKRLNELVSFLRSQITEKDLISGDLNQWKMKGCQWSWFGANPKHRTHQYACVRLNVRAIFRIQVHFLPVFFGKLTNQREIVNIQSSNQDRNNVGKAGPRSQLWGGRAATDCFDSIYLQILL